MFPSQIWAVTHKSVPRVLHVAQNSHFHAYVSLDACYRPWQLTMAISRGLNVIVTSVFRANYTSYFSVSPMLYRRY